MLFVFTVAAIGVGAITHGDGTESLRYDDELRSTGAWSPVRCSGSRTATSSVQGTRAHRVHAGDQADRRRGGLRDESR